jgi:hypothetical protein
MMIVVKLWAPGERYVGLTLGWNGPSLETQELEMQASPAGHTFPQVPQLDGLLVVSTQVLEQHWSLPVQAGPEPQAGEAWHEPPTQVSPDGHAWPQVPQLLRSVWVSVQPDGQHLSEPAQTGPPLHVWQAPPEHVPPAGQTLLQLPQLSVSVSTFVQPVGQH